MSYDNRGQVALWKPQTDNPKAPAAKGTVIAHRDIREGEEVEIALWRNDSDNPKAPLMKGKISDKLGAQSDGAPGRNQPDRHQPSGSGGNSSDGFGDSDIPF